MGMYNWFADKLDEVNWNAKININKKFVANFFEKELLPYLFTTTIDVVHNFSGENPQVITLMSGGIDSSVTAELISKSLQLYTNTTGHKSTFYLLTFKNCKSQEDLFYASFFIDRLKKKYKEINIKHLKKNFSSIEKLSERFLSELTSFSAMRYNFSHIFPRLMNSFALEFSERIGGCFVDSVNLTELSLGEFNVGEGANYYLLSDFYKSMVYMLGRKLNIPKAIMQRDPINSSTGVSKIKNYFGKIPATTTPEDAFNVLDLVIYLIREKSYLPNEIVKNFKHSQKFVDNVYKWLTFNKKKMDSITNSPLSYKNFMSKKFEKIKELIFYPSFIEEM